MRHEGTRKMPELIVALDVDDVTSVAALVEPVEPLAEADDVGVGLEPEGEADPDRAGIGAQPGDAARDEPTAGRARRVDREPSAR